MATPDEKDSDEEEEEEGGEKVYDVEDDDEEEEEEEDGNEEEEEEDEDNTRTRREEKVCFSPDLGVKIHMEDEQSGFNSSVLLPVPGIFGTSKSSTNPLIRLASRTSIKLLCGATVSKEEKEGAGSLGGSGSGVTAPYYPIFLPIDQDFKAKYMWHHRMAKRGRSLKERTYSFLEHPVGWFCFFYHMSV